MTYEKLRMEVTVTEHDGPEEAEAFEQMLTDVFQMYDETEFEVTLDL